MIKVFTRVTIPRLLKNGSVQAYSSSASDCKNDSSVAPVIKNRNPMNLEKMRIGFKPKGFSADKGEKEYWNALELSISSKNTTATVTHWTGRKVCSASTNEWAIEKFLYNKTDIAALKIVGKVLGVRCLETGITEVCLLVDNDSMEKEKMKTFIQEVRNTGLILKEPDQFTPNNPFKGLISAKYQTRIKPWE